jgi:hypothetical protein
LSRPPNGRYKIFASATNVLELKPEENFIAFVECAKANALPRSGGDPNRLACRQIEVFHLPPSRAELNPDEDLRVKLEQAAARNPPIHSLFS